MSTNEGAVRPGPASKPRTSAPWNALVWMLLACLLLGGSVAVRSWQERRFGAVTHLALEAPYPLKEIPTTLGDWVSREGSDQAMDPDTLKISGASDYVIRTYKNRQTGLALSVLVLFGRADFVFGHVPEVCYPSCGFTPVGQAVDNTVALDGRPAIFRTAVYSRSTGLRTGQEKVYYSFLYKGRWVPDVSGRQKEFRHDPRLFKVQVSRRYLPGEAQEGDDPIEKFLRVLVPALEGRLERPSPSPVNANGPAPRQPEASGGEGPQSGVTPSDLLAPRGHGRTEAVAKSA